MSNTLADRVEALTANGNYQIECEIYELIGKRIPSGFEAQYESTRVPRYTTSIDAAMTLVPEGWRFELTNTGFKPGVSLVPPGKFFLVGSYAATPALALCAAALRARSHPTQGETE